jgi:hypothetical protein
MERFVVNHKATLVALAVFVILSWVIGRPAAGASWNALPRHEVCSGVKPAFPTRDSNYRCHIELRWVPIRTADPHSVPDSLWN